MFKKILICIVLLVVGSIIFMVGSISFVNKPKSSNEKVLRGKDKSSKKALIIFQPSLTNVTSIMANSIAKGLNDEGYEVTLNYPGKHLSTDVAQYSLVIFGSPTFGGKPLSIVTDYMSKVKDISSKKVILFSTGANASNKEELEVMEKSLKGIKAYKKIKFISGSKKESESKAYNLGKELSKE